MSDSQGRDFERRREKHVLMEAHQCVVSPDPLHGFHD
jgi:hypothetical protein